MLKNTYNKTNALRQQIAKLYIAIPSERINMITDARQAIPHAGEIVYFDQDSPIKIKSQCTLLQV